MTRLCLALAGGGEISRTIKTQFPPSVSFDILTSFFYLREFSSLWASNKTFIKSWVLDSGAFSAHNSGKPIDLAEFIEACKSLRVGAGHGKLMHGAPPPEEVYALDVIGDWRAGMKNLHKMWDEGVEAIPCYHVGEPWSVLLGYAADYPKIALGGMADMVGKRKIAWAKQCFARVWPKKIHGFAAVSEDIFRQLPFHTVDSTSWTLGPTAFGNWRSLGGKVYGLRSYKASPALRMEMEHYIKMGNWAAARWKKEMAMLDALPAVRPPKRNKPPKRKRTAKP